MEKNIDAAVVVANLQKEAAPLIRAIEKIEVKDNITYDLLSQKISALKQLGKIAETREKSLTDPLKKVIADIRVFFTPFYTRVKELEDEAKDDMLTYRSKTKTKEVSIMNDLVSGKIAKLSTASRKINDLQITSSASSVRKIWTVEEINAEVTPREYLVPDTAKIREALKAGKKVAGWKWVQKDSIAI